MFLFGCCLIFGGLFLVLMDYDQKVEPVIP